MDKEQLFSKFYTTFFIEKIDLVKYWVKVFFINYFSKVPADNIVEEILYGIDGPSGKEAVSNAKKPKAYNIGVIGKVKNAIEKGNLKNIPSHSWVRKVIYNHVRDWIKHKTTKKQEDKTQAEIFLQTDSDELNNVGIDPEIRQENEPERHFEKILELIIAYIQKKDLEKRCALKLYLLFFYIGAVPCLESDLSQLRQCPQYEAFAITERLYEDLLNSASAGTADPFAKPSQIAWAMNLPAEKRKKISQWIYDCKEGLANEIKLKSVLGRIRK